MIALLLLAGCASAPSVPPPTETVNRFLDGSPAQPYALLVSQGYEMTGGAFVRTDAVCDNQLDSAFGVSFRMLRNRSTGEKALCCIAGGGQSNLSGSACTPVAADFEIGPDSFSGEMLR